MQPRNSTRWKQKDLQKVMVLWWITMKTSKLIALAVALAMSGSTLALHTDVVTGRSSSLFIEKGSLYCAGDMANGACTNGALVDGLDSSLIADNQRPVLFTTIGPDSKLWVPTYVGYDNVKSVAALHGRSGFLTNDGRVFWFGWLFDNGSEQGEPVEIEEFAGATDMTFAGLGSSMNSVAYAVVGGKALVYDLVSGETNEVLGLPDDIVAVDGDETHVLFLTADGRLFAAGDNTYGQLGDGSYVVTAPDQAVLVVDEFGNDLVGVQKMSAGRNLSTAVVDGSVYAWGTNQSGALGIGSLDDSITRAHAAPMASLPVSAVNISSASMGGGTVILGSDGSLWGTGWHNGIMGTAYLRTALPTELVDSGIEELYLNNGDVWFVKHEGELKGWGASVYGQHAHGSTLETHNLTLISEFVGGPATLNCPIVAPEIVEIEITGPTVTITETVEVIKEVEVAGPTEYVEVEVAGPTEYVEVPIDLGQMTVGEVSELIVEARQMVKSKKKYAKQRQKFDKCVAKNKERAKRGKKVKHCGDEPKPGWGKGDENHEHNGPPGHAGG